MNKKRPEVRMARRKKILFFACILCFSLLPADWRQDAAVQIADEKEYPRLAASLQAAYAGLPEREKPVASVLIGYCRSRLNDPQAELSWMKRYLEEFRAAAVDLGFLPPSMRQKVRKFIASWREDFPVFWELALEADGAEFAYVEPPPKLGLRVRLSRPCEFQLLAPDGTPLTAGTLGREARTVDIPLAADFVRVASHPLRLLLTLRRAPEKTVEKYFSIDLEYRVPAGAAFDPVRGEVKLMGREMQPESRTEKRVLSKRTRFDKELFKKTVLRDLLIGAAFFVVDATLLKSTVDNSGTSLYAKSALYGTRRVFQLAGFGFSVSALARLPGLFKREKTVAETTVELPEARTANEALRHDLEQARKGVRVRLSVRAI
jgi:hypothetical protein